MLIPKLIHVSWISKDILNSDSLFVQFGLKQLINLNPDWDLQLSDNDEVEKYLQDNLSSFDYALLKDRHIVEKLDVWRLIKLFKEGGLYIDIDRFYNVPLSDIIKEETKCVLPTCLDYDFTHDFMLSAAGNPIHETALQMNLSRRRDGATSVYLLGPQTYMHAVTQCLLGEIVDTNPGMQTFMQIRSLIAQADFIETYRECPPTDTVVFKDKKEFSREAHEEEKRKFYASYGLTHWSGEW